jgi:hypothetical protein
MSSVQAKLFIGSEIRRISLSTKTTFEELVQKVQTFYLIQKPDASPEVLAQLKFKYLDVDEDWVSFSSNEEWREAFTTSKVKDVLKIKVETNERRCHWKERCQKNQDETKTEEKKCPFGNGFSRGGPHCHGRRFHENQQAPQQGGAFDFSQLGNFASFLNPENMKQAQSFITPENIELAKNLFQQFTGGNQEQSQGESAFDFSKMFESFSQFVPKPETEKPAVHNHVICDNCNQTPVGNRFKCNNCEDFDFCQKCFDTVNQNHFEGKHNFIKIEKPQRPCAFNVFRNGQCTRNQNVEEKVEPKVEEEIVMDEELYGEPEPKVEEKKQQPMEEPKKEEKQEDSKLELLHQMGFTDSTVNDFLLKKHKGDIQRVVYELLSSQ